MVQGRAILCATPLLACKSLVKHLLIFALYLRFMAISVIVCNKFQAMPAPFIPSARVDALPVNQQMIEQLALHHHISAEARRSGIDALHPQRDWAQWIMRLTCGIGLSLVLSGLVYFFAFNWSIIPALYKLGLLKSVLLGCLSVSYGIGLSHIFGKLALTIACVLVGILLAVMGQIYQTGADSYLLFAVWAALIFPWVLLSRFAPIWAIWLGTTNLAFYLFWMQIVLPDRAMEGIIFTGLALFNVCFLFLREYLVVREQTVWLAPAWIRTGLVAGISALALIPTIEFILNAEQRFTAQMMAALLGIALHIMLFALYRRIVFDLRELTVTLAFSSVIALTALFKLLETTGVDDAPAFLILGMATLGLFTVIALKILKIARERAASHGA